jgi:hypothetical protein
MPKSKLGFHIDLQAHDGELEKIIAARPRVVKVISAMGILRELHERLGEGTVFIARDWNVGDDFLKFGGPADPVGAAKRWYDGMRSSIVQAPFAYWEGFNEMSGWDAMSQYGAFEAERQRILHNEGYRACVGNFATGCPEIVGDGDLWPRFYPALEAAHRYQNILGLHEYGGLYLWMWYGPNSSAAVRAGRMQRFPGYAEGWLFGRYRKVWAKHLVPNNWTQVRIALTEFGLDRTATADVDFLTGGSYVASWKQAMPWWGKLDQRPDGPQYYVEQLSWADSQLVADPYMVGAAIFTWGTPSPVWGDFDVEGEVASKVCDYVQRIGWPTSSYVVNAPSGLHIRMGPGTGYAPIKVLPCNGVVNRYDETDSDGDHWLEVEDEFGQIGWASARWLTPL